MLTTWNDTLALHFFLCLHGELRAMLHGDLEDSLEILDMAFDHEACRWNPGVEFSYVLDVVGGVVHQLSGGRVDSSPQLTQSGQVSGAVPSDQVDVGLPGYGTLRSVHETQKPMMKGAGLLNPIAFYIVLESRRSDLTLSSLLEFLKACTSRG